MCNCTYAHQPQQPNQVAIFHAKSDVLFCTTTDKIQAGTGEMTGLRQYICALKPPVLLDIDMPNVNGLISYYRLRSVDVDGTEQISKIVSATQSGRQLALNSVYPVPVQDELNVVFTHCKTIAKSGGTPYPRVPPLPPATTPSVSTPAPQNPPPEP